MDIGPVTRAVGEMILNVQLRKRPHARWAVYGALMAILVLALVRTCS